MSKFKAKNLNGHTNGTVPVPPADPYRALLETARLEEAELAGELAWLKPKCEAIEKRLAEVRLVRAALAGIFGEGEAAAAPEAAASGDEARIVFNRGSWPAAERQPAVSAGQTQVDLVVSSAVRALQRAGHGLRTRELVLAIQKDGVPLTGPYVYQKVYDPLRRHPLIFRHEAGGRWSLLAQEHE